MKRLLLSLIALTSLGPVALAGPAETAGKEAPAPMVQGSEDWFRDKEWNFDLFGTYGFTGNAWRTDRYLDADHAWGGGMDASYFFMRYLGVGVEGYLLDADDLVGQASGNLIFRYPIPRTRFAPYGFAGGGAIFNGSHFDDLVSHGHDFRHADDAAGMGQFGTGIELRLTPNVGIMNDFSWNVIDGPRNNFGLVRTGLRFSF